ncbi:MAG: hypothetical protein IK142_00150 [Clostridiales bacterium]|nr:hypothetical protein [Clostridiales bacterium]
MKKRSFIAVLLAAALMMSACGKEAEETEATEATTTTTVQGGLHIVGQEETEETGETEETEPAGPVELTLDNYFDTDPANTEWGQGDGADIIDMVDLDYIQASQESEVFEVDTIEQFASLNYYVNTYPLEREYENLEDPHFFIYVNINNDFDVSGYNWPSLGHEADNHAYSFAGMYIQNGHTISGLQTSLFGDIYGSAVCGIYIDAGTITGNSRNLIADAIDDVRFFDCHISATLEEGDIDPETLFYVTDINVNRYLDCTIDITMPDGEVSTTELQYHPYDTNANNSIMEFFDPDHDGVYEYGANFYDDWVN